MGRSGLLLTNVFIVATCGLVYELLGATVASYLYGNTALEFSLVLGLYLAALGVGAWISRALQGDLARRFLEVELGVAAVGGLSCPLLLYAYGRVAWFRVALDASLVVVGILVGIELPLLLRLLKGELALREVVARALAFDYAGALLASLAFPMLLVPVLGLARTAALCGLFNAGLALAGTWLLRPWLAPARSLVPLRALAALSVAFFGILVADERALAALTVE
jgi:spermidine synthase